MPSELDDRDFPIVRLRTVGVTTDDDLRERFAFFERQLARQRPMALVFDARKSEPLVAAQRKMWGDWLERNDRAIRRYVTGTAILVRSAAVRGVFTAIFWVWKAPVPVVFVGTDDEAERSVRQSLERGIGER